jgi:hypothetical protein
MIKVDVVSVGALSYSICCTYTNVLWPCMKKKEEEKGERWDLLSWGVRAAAVGEGV